MAIFGKLRHKTEKGSNTNLLKRAQNVAAISALVLTFAVATPKDANAQMFSRESAKKEIAETPKHDTHEELLRTNPNYKKNYEIAEKFFFDGASEICAKLALDNKLSENDSKAYLLDTYYSFREGPEAWETKDKKAFLILFDDVARNTASASEINQKFAELMGEAQDYLKNGDASKLSMPIYFSKLVKETSVDDL